MTQLITTTDATFAAQVLASDKPVIVDFWADGCRPCAQLAPVLAELADEHADRLAVATIHIDQNPATARAYGVMSTPTLLVFEGGQPTRSLIGFRPKSRLLRELDLA